MATRTRCWGEKGACVGPYGHTRANQLRGLSVQAGMLDATWHCVHIVGRVVTSRACVRYCVLCWLRMGQVAMCVQAGDHFCGMDLLSRSLWLLPYGSNPCMGWPVLSPEGRMLACRLGCKLADALHLCCLCHKGRPVWLLHLTGLCHTTMLATL